MSQSAQTPTLPNFDLPLVNGTCSCPLPTARRTGTLAAILREAYSSTCAALRSAHKGEQAPGIGDTWVDPLA